MSEPFALGVNYWPRRKAMYWWRSFDPWEVRDEFDVIAGLGMDVVRIFLLWDDFQPSPRAVDHNRLRDLSEVCDAAAARGLRLDVTFFTGHMSGPNWVPRWMLDDGAGHPSPFVRQVVSGGSVVGTGYRNMFVDEETLAASRLLVRTVVAAYRDHPAIWMWNLGNEPDLLAHPPTEAIGRGWVADMRNMIADIDGTRPVTCGLHAASLFERNGLRVDQVFAETDVAVMHGYPMYVPWARDPLDPDFVPFLCRLTSALSGRPLASAAAVVPSTRIATPICLVRFCNREARFTTGPNTPTLICSCEPICPAIASPKPTPMPMRNPYKAWAGS